MRIAYVGAGGKTTRIFADAKKYQDMGYSVFVTTSTHMEKREDCDTSGNVEQMIQTLKEKKYLMAGLDDGKKIKALSYEDYLAVSKYADMVLIEADGSHRKPVKYPKETEPVIYEDVDQIVLIEGFQALGRPAFEVCQRLEKIQNFLDIQEDTLLEESHFSCISQMYLHTLQKNYPEKEIVFEPTCLNLYHRVLASYIRENKELSTIQKEWFQETPTLFICGAGHIAKALYDLATHLEFKIIVMDPREEFVNAQRFEKAEKLICDSFANLEQYVVDNAYYVVVTRGHRDDFQCVQTILDHSFSYIGMIGSKRKVSLTLEKLRETNVAEERIQQIHAPIGLKIGAQTPAEIGISILSEIILEKNKKNISSVSSTLFHTTEKGVLCILVEKTGSSPRNVGSMMLVSNHQVFDSIGGGILEAQVIQDAKEITSIQKREYVVDAQEGHLNMTCGGRNVILFVPI